MFEDNQKEQGVTGATLDTQEDWLLLGNPVCLWNSIRGHAGHQKVHAAEAAEEHIVSEAAVDDNESTTTKLAPTLHKMKKTAKVVQTGGTTAGKETASSSRKQAKEKGKESDKAEETDNEDGEEEDGDEDLDQVLETQQKRKRPSTSQFEGSPVDAATDQPKKQAKTAAIAGSKPRSCSGFQPSRGTVASLSRGGRLQHRRRSK